MKVWLFSTFVLGCGTSFGVPPPDASLVDSSSSDVSTCDVSYVTDANNPCNGPSPCWEWVINGNFVPKGNTCPSTCLCGTPNSSFGRPISCGCGGFCHFGGCIGDGT